MIVKPIGERVLLKHQKKEEVTKGGIYIPESARQEKKEGIVVAVGTFEDGKELPLKKDDHVIYGGYQADEIEIDDEKYICTIQDTKPKVCREYRCEWAYGAGKKGVPFKTDCGWTDKAKKLGYGKRPAKE